MALGGTQTVRFEAGQGANAVHILGHDDSFVVNLEGEIDLVIVGGQCIFPDGNFPHVAARTVEVTYQLDDRIERYQTIGSTHEGDARRIP